MNIIFKFFVKNSFQICLYALIFFQNYNFCYMYTHVHNHIKCIHTYMWGGRDKIKLVVAVGGCLSILWGRKFCYLLSCFLVTCIHVFFLWHFRRIVAFSYQLPQREVGLKMTRSYNNILHGFSHYLFQLIVLDTDFVCYSW